MMPVSGAMAEDPARGIPSEILDQAVAWAVRLQSGIADDSTRADWAAWRNADKIHAQAWQLIESLESAFRDIPSSSGVAAHRVLQAAARHRAVKAGRRRMLKLMGWGAVGVATGLLTATRIPWAQREAYATMIGRRRHITLADGTRLQLNTASAADVVFSPLRRLIMLQRGEISIDTGGDADSLIGPRPLWVETVHARLEAIGTRFVVRCVNDETRVHVGEGMVAAHAEGAQPLLMRAGETFCMEASKPVPMRVLDATFDPTAWTDGVIVAKQMRLDAFVAELSRYSNTPLQLDQGIAGLRVSGVFQLDVRDAAVRALDALARTLPVRIVPGAAGRLTISGT